MIQRKAIGEHRFMLPASIDLKTKTHFCDLITGGSRAFAQAAFFANYFFLGKLGEKVFE
jgi:hypothetical protein